MARDAETKRKFDRLTPAVRLALAAFRARAAARRPGVPGSLFLGLTARCGLACAHCKYRGRPGASDMPLRQALAAVRQAAALGIPKVVFFGGEPLLYPRLVRLVAEAASLGLFTELDTNGQALTQERLDALAGAGLASVMVSLHSPSPAEHDRLTAAGAFRRASAALAAALKAGLVCYVSSCVFSGGLEPRRLRALLSFARRAGAHGARLLPYSPAAGLSRLPADLSAALRRGDPAGFAGTCLARGAAGCAAQRADIIYLGPDGQLRSCPYSGRKLGAFGRLTLAAAATLAAGRKGGPRPCQEPC